MNNEQIKKEINIFMDETNWNGYFLLDNEINKNYCKDSIFFAVCSIDKEKGKFIEKKFEKWKKRWNITEEIKGTDLVLKKNNELLISFLNDFFNASYFELTIFNKEKMILISFFSLLFALSLIKPVKYFDDIKKISDFFYAENNKEKINFIKNFIESFFYNSETNFYKLYLEILNSSFFWKSEKSEKFSSLKYLEILKTNWNKINKILSEKEFNKIFIDKINIYKDIFNNDYDSCLFSLINTHTKFFNVVCNIKNKFYIENKWKKEMNQVNINIFFDNTKEAKIENIMHSLNLINEKTDFKIKLELIDSKKNNLIQLADIFAKIVTKYTEQLHKEYNEKKQDSDFHYFFKKLDDGMIFKKIKQNFSTDLLNFIKNSTIKKHS